MVKIFFNETNDLEKSRNKKFYCVLKIDQDRINSDLRKTIDFFLSQDRIDGGLDYKRGESYFYTWEHIGIFRG